MRVHWWTMHLSDDDDVWIEFIAEGILIRDFQVWWSR